jgi:hypothetical protein
MPEHARWRDYSRELGKRSSLDHFLLWDLEEWTAFTAFGALFMVARIIKLYSLKGLSLSDWRGRTLKYD